MKRVETIFGFPGIEIHGGYFMEKSLRVFFIILVLTACVPIASVAQIRDYYLFNWGDSKERVYDVCSLLGIALEKKGSNYLTFSEYTRDGQTVWTDFYFTKGFSLAWQEVFTNINSMEYKGERLELYMKPRLIEIIHSNSGKFDLASNGQNWYLWKGDNEFAGSFYLEDDRGYYHTFSFICRKDSAAAAILTSLLLDIGQPINLGSVLEK